MRVPSQDRTSRAMRRKNPESARHAITKSSVATAVSTNAVVTPRQVDVNLIGAPDVIRALRAEQVVPRVDLTKVEGVDLKGHGSTTVKVIVDVAGAVAEVQPPSVTVKW